MNAQLHTIADVQDRLHIGRSMVFELIANGKLRSVKVGRRRLVSEAAIADFIASLETAE